MQLYTNARGLVVRYAVEQTKYRQSIQKRARLVEIEKMVQTLERRQLHLIALLFRLCHEKKLIRSWRRLSSITFIIDIISFYQYFRSLSRKICSKTIKSGVESMWKSVEKTNVANPSTTLETCSRFVGPDL